MSERDDLAGPERRGIRVYTRRGSVEGRLLTHPGVSTLHYLNEVANQRNFLALHGPVRCTPSTAFDDGALALSPSSILFVVETSECVPQRSEQAGQYRRSLVRLQLDDFVVDGFAHVPHGTDALSRLDHDRHPFFALTSVSAVAPHAHVTAPFMAIHRRHVEALQLLTAEPALDLPAAIDLDVAD
jgi:hypothetical protein